MGTYGEEPSAIRRAGVDTAPARTRTALSEALTELRRLTKDPLFDGVERALTDLGGAPDRVRSRRGYGAQTPRVERRAPPRRHRA
jgi:hypothetical protein